MAVETTADDMRTYIRHSVARNHLVACVPDYEGTKTVTATTCIFIASRPPISIR